MRTKPLLLTALLLFFSSYRFIYAQQVFLTLQGKIVDAKNSPVSFASISVSSRSIGIQSNASGLFSLKIPEDYRHDTLIISHVGYEVHKMAVAALLAKETTPLIELKDRAVELKEVVVSDLGASKLIEAAIAKISQNYYRTPHTIKGFYRVDTKRETEPIQLSEAVFDVYNYGLGSNKQSQLRLQKMRRIKDEKASHGIDFGMTSQAVLDLDIVNTIHSSDIFNAKDVKQYIFKLEGLVDYNRRKAYEIGFDQKDGLKKSLYKGKIYLDSETLAFVSLHFSRSPKGIRYAKYASPGTRAMMTILGIRMDLKGEDYKVDYKKFGSKWTLSSVNNTAMLGLKSNRELYDFTATINVDYVVTEMDSTASAPFRKEETLADNKFIEFQTSEPDSLFWKDHNILLADYDVDKVLEHIHAKNNALNLRKQVERSLSKLPKDVVLRIDSIISFYHTKGDFNGNALVQLEGKTMLSKQYGFANKERKIPHSATSSFRIGSLTKSFTALLIQQLCSEGKLGLTDTVGKFFPTYIHKGITLEQLLTHTSGIPNFTTNNDHLSEVMMESKPLQEIVLRYCSGALEFKSGESFRYSNSGYVVLAAIIETVTGSSYGQVLKEKILDPLEMNHTSFGQESLNTTGYLYNQPEPGYKVANLAGASGISSTVDDLIKWNKALSDASLVGKDRLNSLFSPRSEYSDWNAFYGYGWMIDRSMFASSKKHKIIYHPGTDLGYYSMFVRQPDKNILIILLNNTGDFSRFDMTDLILEEINR